MFLENLKYDYWILNNLFPCSRKQLLNDYHMRLNNCDQPRGKDTPTPQS